MRLSVKPRSGREALQHIFDAVVTWFLFAFFCSSFLMEHPHADALATATSGGLNVAHLTKLCYASSLSYLPIEKIPSSEYYSYAQQNNLKPLAQVVEPRTESGATIFEDGVTQDTLIVACRGSATPRNFATNLRFQLVPLSSRLYNINNSEPPNADDLPRVHEGFAEAAEGLWEKLEPILLELGDGGGKPSIAGNAVKKKNIIFTGHSLGGGTAEICALHASVSFACVSELVTFGGPLIGDAAFARYVNKKALPDTVISHLVHGADPILANNGPLWEQLGFERTGTEVLCDPYVSKLFGEQEGNGEAAGGDGIKLPPWNIIDHCKYLGVYVGPRWPPRT